jgi:hypothetical protein
MPKEYRLPWGFIIFSVIVFLLVWFIGLPTLNKMAGTPDVQIQSQPHYYFELYNSSGHFMGNYSENQDLRGVISNNESYTVVWKVTN